MAMALLLLVTSILIENLLLTALGEGTNGSDNGISVSFGPCLLDINDPCTSDKIMFYFYTRESQENGTLLKISEKHLPPGYNVSLPTKIIIHGYAGGVDFKAVVALRRAYQQVGKFNIIVVDWGELANLPCYPTAVVNTLQAGRCTAKFLSNLASLSGSEPGKYHIIGFSLGAHVAAFASNEIQKKQGKRLERITGLDPALPFFASLTNSWKLDKGDATFVDIIHTNVGVFGKIEATGHVDFYVNEGTTQPACSQAQNVPLCSHNMSLNYFAESVTTSNEKGFWGVACSSFVQHVLGLCEEPTERSDYALMGENCDKRSRGVYFVPTRDRPPYALGIPKKVV